MSAINRVADLLPQENGLYGEQLDSKRTLFGIRLNLFNGQRTKKTLLWLLDALDTYLDSIISATGFGEALKETKEVLRNSIDA